MATLTERERQLALKPVDSVWTVVFIDPVVIRVLPRLVSVEWITPVRLTITAQLVGLLAAGFLGTGQLLLGALAFELRFVIDCLDGKLARLRGQTSRLGAVLDTNGDRVVVTAAFASLAWWAEQPWLAFAVSTSYLLSFMLRELRDEVHAAAGIEKPSERFARRGLGAALRRRRIHPTITTIEIEHLTLVAVPLLAAAGVDLVDGALVAAAAALGLQSVRFAVTSLRAAAAIDHGSS